MTIICPQKWDQKISVIKSSKRIVATPPFLMPFINITKGLRKMRTFADLRPSKDNQTTKQQIMVIGKASYDLLPHRQVSEIVSGKIAATVG